MGIDVDGDCGCRDQIVSDHAALLLQNSAWPPCSARRRLVLPLCVFYLYTVPSLMTAVDVRCNLAMRHTRNCIIRSAFCRLGENGQRTASASSTNGRPLTLPRRSVELVVCESYAYYAPILINVARPAVSFACRAAVLYVFRTDAESLPVELGQTFDRTYHMECYPIGATSPKHVKIHIAVVAVLCSYHTLSKFMSLDT